MTTITRRGSVLGVLIALLWTLVGVGAASPAAAHTEMISSTPSNGSVLASSPETARLVFNEKVSPVTGGISLRAGVGEKVQTGKAFRAGKTVVVPIEETLAAGSYLLSYRVVSADGHTVKGTIAFRVRG